MTGRSLDGGTKVSHWLRTMLFLIVLEAVCFALPSCTSYAQEGRQLSGHSDAVYAIAYSPAGKLMASGSYDKTVKLWDLSTEKEIATLEAHQDQVFRVAFSADGSSLVSCSADGTAVIWDIKTRKVRNVLAAGDEVVIDATFSGNNRWVATAGSNVRLWDRASGKLIWSQAHPQPFFAISYSPKQQQLVCGSHNLVRLCDVADGKMTRDLNSESGMVYEVDFSPDGDWVVSAGSSGKLTLWNVADGRRAAEVTADQSSLFTATFSTDGKRVLTGGRERVIRIWTVPELRLVKEIRGPRETILTVSASPHDRQLACGTYDGTIHLWTDLPGDGIPPSSRGN